jgi:hypothetical protein
MLAFMSNMSWAAGIGTRGPQTTGKGNIQPGDIDIQINDAGEEHRAVVCTPSFFFFHPFGKASKFCLLTEQKNIMIDTWCAQVTTAA